MAREMKDSGVDWIGEIPCAWGLSKIGHVYTEKRIKVSDRDYPPLSVTMRGILPQLDTAAKTDAHDDRKLLCKGDFAINSRSDRRGSCGISQMDGSVSLINIVLQPKEEMNLQYYEWMFHSSMFSDEFYKWGHGIVDDLWTTGWQDMKKITIPTPALQEQKKIAVFLNEQCRELDDVFDKIRASIEEYKNLRQVIITQAVTKGARDNREMKDSGIEWIGEIPKEWHMSKLKYLISSPLQYGASETGVDYNEELPRYIRITDITIDNKLKEDGKLSLEEATAMPYLLFDDDILFSRSGATVGKTFLYKAEYGKAAFAGYLIRASIDENKAVPKFVYYSTLSQNYDIWKNSMVTQATIQNIGADKYSNYIIAMPLLEEQLEIVEYLDNKISEINKIIQKKEQYLTEIENYKKSLIYEYVTGKKEVLEKYQA